MINPTHITGNLYKFRGFPASIKKAEYNPNLINVIFHKDTTKNYERAEDLISTSAWLNEDGDKFSLGEIALMCENRYVVVICEKVRWEKKGRSGYNYNIKDISIIPMNAYENEYTKTELEKHETISDNDLEEMPF